MGPRGVGLEIVDLQGKTRIWEFCGKRLGGGDLCSMTGAALHLGIPLYPSVLSQACPDSL